ncbi:YggT family protein [Priestia taiwanensis]|uniref:Membrane protein YlmG n=1 Tax=Priestia taiwanensis TaxID=1347902 RepID=A0A917APP6_9BACI|nr:YggT family protein [Priestia taiwanensis]MBM7362923.1 YggT family protein [Priestia taiwanensis]GGE66195.1 putative membrane protein YlmG [Priestia taiwanensis]
MLLVLEILQTILSIYSYFIIGYILMSFFPGARDSALGTFLGTMCEPFLEPFRRIIPPLGMIDLSPLVAILVLRFAGEGLWSLFRLLNLI